MKSEKSEGDRVDKFVKEFYCGTADEYMKYWVAKGVHAEDVLMPLFKNVVRVVGSWPLEMLDLGCGFNGNITDISFARYIGIDLSASLIRHHPFRKKHNCMFMVDDIRTVQYQRLRYNFVLGALIFNYIADPKLMFDRLKKRGCAFCLAIPNPEYDKLFGEVYADGTVLLKIGDVELCYYHHSVEYIRNSLGAVKAVQVAYSTQLDNGTPPVYVCVYGVW